ncbi:unnamed protein product [Didymodactylos carnosus]|uniref:ABM domain-containing protein n=1 Tax=Didymodactylos carnosus TaxID=1234261 RepID=A0A814J5J4_9BILA|nr:unnamed protein product [Didymodactylos carnosus]CAF1076404.1 unnamed protein product [Didymodactylos carnosus]CAF3804212.1 unnamed protein product [Didymodactylos carnosus]CAF3840042.1 unnamed protein product [Didymodactylos carnosus]
MSALAVLHVVVDIYVQSDKAERVKKLLYDLASQAKREEGCMRYRLCEDLADKTHLICIEQWETELAYEDHLKTEHIKKCGEELKDDLASPAEVRRYKIVQIESTVKKETTTNSSGFCNIL